MEKIIDAKNKKIGRVASAAAKALLGKDQPDFQNHVVADVTVVINNASKADVSDKKKTTTEYERYSGHPGGIKFEKMTTVIAKKGYGELFKQAVYGMLPPNRLRKERMKNLTVNE